MLGGVCPTAATAYGEATVRPPMIQLHAVRRFPSRLLSWFRLSSMNPRMHSASGQIKGLALSVIPKHLSAAWSENMILFVPAKLPSMGSK